MEWKKYSGPLVIIGGIVVADRMTKIWAVDTLQGLPSRSYLGDTIRILYAENVGAFLSLGAELPETARFWLLAIIPILALGYFAYFLLFQEGTGSWQRTAFAFIIAGGGSNIVDRLREGKVVDFLNVGIGDLRSGIFNLADMAIMTGLFLLLPSLFKSRKNPESEVPAMAEKEENSETPG